MAWRILGQYHLRIIKGISLRGLVVTEFHAFHFFDQRETERDRDRDRDRERQRQTDTQTQTQRHRQRQTDRQTDRDTEREPQIIGLRHLPHNHCHNWLRHEKPKSFEPRRYLFSLHFFGYPGRTEWMFTCVLLAPGCFHSV